MFLYKVTHHILILRMSPRTSILLVVIGFKCHTEINSSLLK